MGASVINVYFMVVMPANRLSVNHFDFMALCLADTVSVTFTLCVAMVIKKLLPVG